MRVAITHDWLSGIGGSERVLEQLLRLYPEADLYTAMDHLPEKRRQILLGARVFTSYLQKLPLSNNDPRKLLPLLPNAMGRFDLSPYDLVISNSRIAAKFVRTRPGQVHIGYMSSASRFRWDLQLRHLQARARTIPIGGQMTALLLDHLRVADEASTARIDRIVTTSRSVATRLGASYQRPIHVIHPPVDIDFWSPQQGVKREDFYLALLSGDTGARMDPVVEAFSSMPHRRLLVVGDNESMGRSVRGAASNVEFRQVESDEVLRDLMRKAKALVHATPDELGLLLVEAQGCGLPVITLERAAALEIVQRLDSDAPSGIFFEDRRPASIVDAVERFEREKYRIYSAACRESAIRFRPEAFRAQFSSLVSETLEESSLHFGRPLLQVSRETAVPCRIVEEQPWGVEEALDAVAATVDVYV